MSEPKTLRQWAGLARPENVRRAATALVVIDMQQDYFSGKLIIPDGEKALRHAAKLLAWAREQGILVAHIQQQSMKPGSPLFSCDSPLTAFHETVAPLAGELVVVKHFPSSFTKTELHERLQEKGIATLVLCGLMTHMCVSTTARGALELGYGVVIASDACASRDLPSQTGGGVIPHSVIHEAALAALGDRFAEIMTTGEITGLAVE